MLLLVILSLLMVVAENKMEELSLRHWLEAEATRYDDDWLRLGMAAPSLHGIGHITPKGIGL